MSGYHKAPGTNAEEKPVEVDQRGLIQKVLARYPGEFTLFRELLQNSDDAQSHTVQIYFETAAASPDPPTLSDVQPSDIVRWTFKNDGSDFTDEDWARLSKIAKGNSNPAKVGAFGVGFYSLFSVTDHPIVSSGGIRMEFYVRDDLLYSCKTKLASKGGSSQGTTIEVPLFEPGIMPKNELMRFLATSITFMAHLETVEVFRDKDCLGCINKIPGLTEVINPHMSLPHSSPSGRMTVYKLECHRFTIEAKISTEFLESTLTRSFKKSRVLEARPQSNNFLATTSNFCTTKADLTLFTAEVHVKVDHKLSKGLLRSTSKQPPSQLQYSLVYTGKDEYDQSFLSQESKNQPSASVFQGLHADLDGASHPRIFIGHSTSQTTGIGGHMAAPFIPTVERESIDLVDRNVAVWNRELLYVGGFLARVVYELELTAMENLWRRTASSSQLKFQERLRDRFIHVLKFFTFYDSTPSPKVAEQMQHSFYGCSALPLRLLSSVGVHHATDIRLFDPLRSKFLKHVPMLLPEVAEVAWRIVNALPQKDKIGTITLEDMLQDLRQHTLDEAGLLTYLEWQISHGSTADMTKLSKVISFVGPSGTIIQLSAITSCIDPMGPGAHIPLDGPMPPFLIPRGIAKHFSLKQLVTLGWREFTIADWLRYISQGEIRSVDSKYDFFQSVEWAECVLHIISIAWSSSDEVRGFAKSVFANQKCIPVKDKLYRPTETYLPDGNILASDDLNLPVVQFPSGRGITQEMADLLVALEVQQHLAPSLLLKQMVKKKWNTSKLIDYLVKAASTLNPKEIDELKSYEAFAGLGGKNDDGKKRFRADELYPPIPTFQQLDLRVIDWSGRPRWEDKTPEAELMYRLGLRRHPPLQDIVTLCSQDTDVGKRAFDHLCTHFRTVYSDYKPDKFQHIAFIPAKNTGGLCLEKPGDVFLDNKWAVFELSVIQYKDREATFEELGVQRHPPSSLLLQLLKGRPRSGEIARQWFEILSHHVSCFAPNELETLSQSSIVPKTISGQDREWLTPVQCYLGKSTKHDLYSKLFHFVDFGSEAIQFLRACGAKNEPYEEDVAEYLVGNHEKFYKLAGHERFMQELRDLAAKHTRVSNITISQMMLHPVLPGTQREKTTSPDGWKRIYSLWKPKDIVIVNDVPAYQLFGDSIVAAPENMSPELEDFYVSLGCHYLTTVIREECNPHEEKADQVMRSKYRNLITPRLYLFLHHYQPHAWTVTPCFSGPIDVRVCGHLSVSRTLFVRNTSTTEKQSVWATAMSEQGTIIVWVSCSAKQNMYELAVSLCRVLFKAVKLNDALLLMSILSEEDLDVLRGRGYEVDQVLQSPQYLNSVGSQQTAAGTDADLMPAHTNAHLTARGSETASKPASSSAMPLTLIKVTNNVRDAYHFVSRIMSGIATSGSATPLPGAECLVTPHGYIRSTASEAIQACKSRPFHHRDEPADMIRFALDDGYCNVSDWIESLRPLGPMGEVEVLVGQGISDDDSFREEKQDQVDHFVGILTSLAEIYGLPMDSLRIFYDTAAGCIAFNRKNTIYLNLRYFEAWHYQDVKDGHPDQALSSWFLTLAHEIAHNLVTGHDPEHEFWSSAISEARLGVFSRLLCSSDSGTVQV